LIDTMIWHYEERVINDFTFAMPVFTVSEQKASMQTPPCPSCAEFARSAGQHRGWLLIELARPMASWDASCGRHLGMQGAARRGSLHVARELWQTNHGTQHAASAHLGCTGAHVAGHGVAPGVTV
jgi:hypothetical protein